MRNWIGNTLCSVLYYISLFCSFCVSPLAAPAAWWNFSIFPNNKLLFMLYAATRTHWLFALRFLPSSTIRLCYRDSWKWRIKNAWILAQLSLLFIDLMCILCRQLVGKWRNLLILLFSSSWYLIKSAHKMLAKNAIKYHRVRKSANLNDILIFSFSLDNRKNPLTKFMCEFHRDIFWYSFHVLYVPFLVKIEIS